MVTGRGPSGGSSEHLDHDGVTSDGLHHCLLMARLGEVPPIHLGDGREERGRERGEKKRGGGRWERIREERGEKKRGGGKGEKRRGGGRGERRRGTDQQLERGNNISWHSQ